MPTMRMTCASDHAILTARCSPRRHPRARQVSGKRRVSQTTGQTRMSIARALLDSHTTGSQIATPGPSRSRSITAVALLASALIAYSATQNVHSKRCFQGRKRADTFSWSIAMPAMVAALVPCRERFVPAWSRLVPGPLRNSRSPLNVRNPKPQFHAARDRTPPRYRRLTRLRIRPADPLSRRHGLRARLGIPYQEPAPVGMAAVAHGRRQPLADGTDFPAFRHCARAQPQRGPARAHGRPPEPHAAGAAAVRHVRDRPGAGLGGGAIRRRL